MNLKIKKIKSEKYHFILGAVLLLSFFMRFHHIKLAGFNFDHERDAWAVRKMVISRKPTLIGPDIRRESVRFFLGPYHYYFLLPSYLLTNLDPIGSLIFGAGFGVGTTYLAYFVAKRLFSQKVGLLAAFFHAASFNLSEFERSPLNSYSSIYLSLLFILFFAKTIKGNPLYLPLATFIFGLMLQSHFVNFFFAPIFLLIVPRWFSLKKNKWQILFLAFLAFLITFLPLIIFDLRHDFLNFRAFFFSASSRFTAFKPWRSILPIYEEFCKGLGMMFFKEAHLKRFLTLTKILISLPLVYFFIGILDSWKRNRRNLVLIFLFSLLLLPLISFIIFSGDIEKAIDRGEIQPYYFAGSWMAYILLVTSLFAKILRFFYGRMILMIGLILFVVLNLPFRIFYRDPYGYIYKKMVIDFILEENKKMPFKNFKVSFVNAAGFNTGYKYLFTLKGVSEGVFENIDKNSFPVYTIIVPSRWERIIGDYVFGDIGLVLPEGEAEI